MPILPEVCQARHWPKCVAQESGIHIILVEISNLLLIFILDTPLPCSEL
jgi:hypothetical protein